MRTMIASSQTHTPLSAVSLEHLAWATGHKIKGLCRRPSDRGLVLWCQLDGKAMPCAEARALLERQYMAGCG
jgi:hypothetical protein